MNSELKLIPVSGVEIKDGRTVASETPAWLRVAQPRLISRSRWIRLRYHTSYFDNPVRPLIRFKLKSGEIVHDIMNGAISGVGVWVGPVPKHVVEVDISPTNVLGPFDFKLVCSERVSRLRLWMRGPLRNWKWRVWSLVARLIGARGEARHALRFIGTSSPLTFYDRWIADRSREVDLAGIDRPRSSWETGPRIHLFETGDSEVDSRATIISLRRQLYKKWCFHSADGRTLGNLEEVAGGERGRSQSVLRDGDFYGFIEAGSELHATALATLVEYIARYPTKDVIYGDEEVLGTTGRVEPLLKPDWSPTFNKTVDYIGGAVFFKWPVIKPRQVRDPKVRSATFSRDVGKFDIGHIRRVLLRRRGPPFPGYVDSGNLGNASEEGMMGASIIIPTRDRRDLLEKCIRTLLEITEYNPLEVIVVDNGSTDPAALDYLNEIASLSGVKVLKWPHPFNYSAMCNLGASIARYDLLVFLNNDVEITERGWLKALATVAVHPTVGSVGAKLLYSSGRVQHAGVVLGLGGYADHVYQGLSAEHAGYLHQLQTCREVSANTGACLAVLADKFRMAGGFDHINLPVDLNDIDLCLRLHELGLRNIWAANAHVVHHESASRGRVLKWFTVYQRERRYFESRWLEQMRDDPFFHPALSLYSLDVMLA